jgi:hypothetical protein
MNKAKHSNLETLLKIDYQEDDKIWLTNSLTLRKIIGTLGMAMPLLLFVFLYLDNGLLHPLESISHYYYTRVSGIFVIILSLLAVFLIVYKGKKLVDFYISLIAGICILLVVLFPTNNITNICCDPTKKYSITILPESDFRMYFHYTVAALFFVCLSYMCIFLFTKSNKSAETRGTQKTIRNRIYRICGVIIHKIYFKNYPITFWAETMAVECFGFAWLVKGETLFKD